MSEHKVFSRESATIARGAAVNFLTLVAKLGRPLFYLVAARCYGPSIFGLYFLAWTYIEILAGIATLGLEKGLIRFIVYHTSRQEEQEAADCFRMAILIGSGLGLILSLALFFLADHIAPLLHHEAIALPLRWMSLIIFFQTVSRLLIQAPMARKVMKYQFYIKGLLEPFLLTGLALLFSYTDLGIKGLCAAHFITMAIVLLASIFPSFKYFPLRSWFHWPIKFHPEILRFSGSMFLADCIFNFNGRLDVILLGTLVSSEVIGVYGIMVQIANVLPTIRMAFDGIVNPIFTELHTQEETPRLSHTYQLTTRWIMLASIPLIVLVALYGRDIAAMAGSAYQMGYPWLLALLLGTTAVNFFGLAGYLLAMTGHPDTLLSINLISLIINAVVTYLLAKILGPQGAALGVSLVFIVTQTLYVRAVSRRLKIHPFQINLWKPLLSGLITAGVLITIHSFRITTPLGNLLVHVPLVFILYGATLIGLGLEPEERRLGISLCKKMGWGP